MATSLSYPKSLPEVPTIVWIKITEAIYAGTRPFSREDLYIVNEIPYRRISMQDLREKFSGFGRDDLLRIIDDSLQERDQGDPVTSTRRNPTLPCDPSPDKFSHSKPKKKPTETDSKSPTRSQSGTGKTAALVNYKLCNNGAAASPPADETDDKPSVAAEAALLTAILKKKLAENQKEVYVDGNDPTSPLYAVKSFEELPLSEQLRRGVNDMGFNEPSKFQKTALPMLLADPPNNMIAQSQSGTGKTAAAVLAMLNRVDATIRFTQVLCLSPTRERALQTGKLAKQMGKYCPEVKIGYAVRGAKVSKGQEVMYHIVFGTPGTLLDWILRHRVIDPKKIKMFVLDEADVMITFQGHQDQSTRIRKTLPKDCQMLLVSATYMYDEEVMKFAKDVVPNPFIIRVRRGEESLDNIKQFYVRCRDKEDKFQALANIYGVVSIGQCIVHCHTHKAASWLAERMTGDGHAVALLSGEITVEDRVDVLDRFRAGKERLLIIVYDVSVHDIDMEQVTVVVNFDIPVLPSGKPDCETYLHRIGRTGRFGKSDIVINLIYGQWSVGIIRRIEENLENKITLLETNDVDELEQLT